MRGPGVAGVVLLLLAEALEELHCGVNPMVASVNQARAQPVKILGIEFRQIELWLPIQRHARTRAQVRQRFEQDLFVRPRRVGRRHPVPEAHEIVVMLHHHVDVGGVVETRHRGQARNPESWPRCATRSEKWRARCRR